MDENRKPVMTQEQIDYFAALNEESSRRASRRTWRNSIAGYLMILAGAVAFSLLTINALSDSTHSTDAKLRAASVSSCERVNILRAQSNISDAVVFDILSASGRRELALAKTDTEASRKVHEQSAEIVFRAADKLTVTPLTDCKQAVDDAAIYKFPLAGPIGNARTGKLGPKAQQVVDSSNVLAGQTGA